MISMTLISLLVLGSFNRNCYLKVHNDIGEALDEGFTTALIILDLSAAFDVIDHLILLRSLKFSFGIKEKALTWVK